MPILSEPERKAVELFNQFITTSIKADNSFLSEKKEIFTLDNLNIIHKKYVEGYIVGSEKDFDQKLNLQLNDVNDDVKEVMAHLLWLYLLCPIMYEETKVQKIKPWLKTELNKSKIINGIIKTGAYYFLNKYHEVKLLLEIFIVLKSDKTKIEPNSLIHLIKSYTSETNPVIKNILYFLIDSDKYENIASTTWKSEIREHWSALSNKEDIDEAISEIRQKLIENDTYPPNFRFWESDIFKEWSKTKSKIEGVNYWQIAPGEGARLWDEFKNEGNIRVGWSKTPDLSDIDSESKLDDLLVEYGMGESKLKRQTSKLWQFLNGVKQGDIIIANKGKSEIVGIGEVVDGEYFYIPDKNEYRHAKKVEWKEMVPFAIPPNNKFGTTICKLSKEEYDGIMGVLPKDNYWIFNPTKNWDYFLLKGEISVGFDKLGDLSKFNSKKEIGEKIKELYAPHKKPNQFSLICYDFASVLKPGDYFYVFKGINPKEKGRLLLGYGKIISELIYDESRDKFKNYRKVEWLKTGEWPDNEGSFVQKTLTNVSEWDETIRRFKKLIDGGPSSIKSYWWLNALPSIWDFDKMQIGEIDSYTSYNEKGNTRKIFRNFQNVKIDDNIIVYIAAPKMVLAGECKITNINKDDNEVKSFEFIKVASYENRVKLENLKENDELKDSEPLSSNMQGSLFKLTIAEYDTIKKIIGNNQPPSLADIFLEEQEFQGILDLIKYKKNIILQGPPGVGKTFIAKRIAYSFMNEKNDERIEMIQFHQSYSYEDFIQGYRPTEDGKFVLSNGIFFDFCKKAQLNPDRDYFFIIDEINRGNLSKIFGELMMLIEKDKRGAGFSIPLTYSRNQAERFYIPENLYMIGTMNTADRSLAMVDYALRRRFGFVNLNPSFYTVKFNNFLEKNNVPAAIIKIINERMTNLNKTISEDQKNLGIGYQIGHSYFCPDKQDVIYDWFWYESVVKNEIEPLLKEYWFDNPNKVNDEVNKLLLK